MIFPDPIYYSRETSSGWKIQDWDTANKLLSYQNLKDNSFTIFEKPCGSYIQCAGSKTCLTVEARIYDVNGSFNHYVFGKGEIAGNEVKIPTKNFYIEVDTSQVLKMRDARLIIKPWLEGADFPSNYTKSDVTEKFKKTEQKH